MSQYDDDDDFDDDIDGGINAVRKALRASEKRAKALEQELSTFRKEGRQRTLASAIEAKGLNPKIAAFVPSDVEPDGIAAWLDEFGDVFAPVGAPAAGTTEQEPPVVPEGADTFSQITGTGAAPSGDEGSMMALISGAKTKEELDQLIFGRSM